MSCSETESRWRKRSARALFLLGASVAAAVVVPVIFASGPLVWDWVVLELIVIYGGYTCLSLWTACLLRVGKGRTMAKWVLISMVPFVAGNVILIVWWFLPNTRLAGLHVQVLPSIAMGAAVVVSYVLAVLSVRNAYRQDQAPKAQS